MITFRVFFLIALVADLIAAMPAQVQAKNIIQSAAE